MAKSSEIPVYFIGSEIEKTPAYGKKTLFIRGARTNYNILEYTEQNSCKHVRFSCGNSWKGNKALKNFIEQLLNLNILVTVEYPHDDHEYIIEHLREFMSNHHFIPIVSFKIQNIENTSRNLTVKISDDPVEHTNIGNWCHNFSQLIDINSLTMWEQYESFEVLQYNNDIQNSDKTKMIHNKAKNNEAFKSTEQIKSEQTDDNLTAAINAYLSK